MAHSYSMRIAVGSLDAKQISESNVVCLGEVRMIMPRRWSGKGWNSVLNAAGIRYSNALIISKREVRLERELLISDWSLPASQAGAYQELVAKVRENWVTIFGRVVLGRIGPAAGGFFTLTQQPLRKMVLLIWVIWFLWFLFKAATG